MTIDPLPPGSKQGAATFDGKRVAAGAVSRDDFTYCIVDVAPVAPKGGDRRREDRQRTRLRDGVLAEGRGRIVGDCRISNRSKLGARLQLDKDHALPGSFLLTDPASHTRFRATLIWQKGREAGVKLVPAE